METKDFDSYSERKAFDETKEGVKGLVDAHITEVPRIFRLPRETLSFFLGSRNPYHRLRRRPRVVENIKDAAEKWGFFQVVNHGVPLSVLEEMRDGVRRFFEQDLEVKKSYLSRDATKKFVYNSNFHLYSSTASVNWRDSFACYMSPNPPTPEELPVVCRGAMIEHWKHMMSLGALLFELLSEALGLSSDMLKSMDCMKGLFMICHYYPPCPQPDRTIGTNHHSDNSFLTILLQDQVGGLQILHQDCWVDVSPIPGALVINIGDFMQTQGFLMTQAPSSSHNHGVVILPKCVGFFPDDQEIIQLFLTARIQQKDIEGCLIQEGDLYHGTSKTTLTFEKTNTGSL
ncbi:unnamed protein product [Brassica oleracea]